MEATNQQLVILLDQALALLGGAVFGALTLVGLVGLVRHRDRASGWFAGMFGILTFVLAVGLLLDDIGADSLERRVMVAVLSLFPFFLWGFTRTFAHAHVLLDVLSVVLTVGVLAAILSTPIPADRDQWTGVTVAIVVVFLAHWVLLSVASILFFLREARRSVGVAGRRMRLFAAAAAVLAAALLLSGVAGGDEQDVRTLAVGATVQLGGTVAAILFWFALAPPRWLRSSWRSREYDHMQGGLRELLAGETAEDVHQRTLATALRLTGGAGAIVLDEAGEPVACEGFGQETADRVLAEARGGGRGGARRRVFLVDRIVVACGPAAPFFGTEEERLLGTISAFASLAEERARTLDRERTANERLRQVDQLKTEFVAMVAHDLRSPMAVISGFADTIHDRWDELADEDKLSYLRLISRNTRSLSEFVEDVLQVARMESGELHYEVEPFDPRAVVQRIVTEMQVSHPGLTLTVDAPNELPAALGDEERNWQILTNLVSNAVKFSEGDPDVRLQLRELPDERAVAIAVRDYGIGIDSEDLPRLFRRFSRVGQRQRAISGTGLGLYIVKAMVEAQGGRIWVQSTPGEGSTFTYTLPVAQGGAST